MNYTCVINGAVWGGALTYYYIDARKWFTGPKITIDTDGLTKAQAQAIRDEGLEIDATESRSVKGFREGERSEIVV